MNLGSHPAWQPVSCLFVPKIAVSAMVLADGRFGYGLSSVYRDDRRWGDRCRDEPQLCMQMSMRGAMYVTMTMMRPGLFLQREEPGSEPGNSLVRPDDRGLRVRS